MAARLLCTTPLSKKQNTRAALSLLKSCHDPTRILTICRSLTPTSPLDRTALSIAVSNLSTSGHLPAVRSLIDGLHTRFPSQAILLFGQAGMLDDALRVFNASPNVSSLNALLSACIAAKNHGEVARIFREFPRCYNITRNIDTYNTALKAMCAYSVFDEMCKKGIRPNTASFCIALEGFYREERFDDVERVLELMKKNDCYLDVATYNVRIQSLCKLKRSGDAKAVFKEMLSMGLKPNWVTYSNLVVGFCKEGDLEEGKKVYKEMRSKGCVAGSSFYFTLIYYLCQGEEFEMALGICKEIMERNWMPCFSTMKMLVHGLVSKYKVDEARDIVRKMKQKFPKNAEMWKEVEDGLPP